MANIYYCKKCRKTFSGGGKGITCPTCGKLLVETDVDLDDWKSKSDEEKETLIKQFDNIPYEPRYSNSSEEANSIGNALKTYGTIFIVLTVICAVAVLIAIGSEDGALSGLIAGILVAAGGCLSGLMLQGFGEIINLLQDIKNKQ